jgi:asparagine synthase (glutamine-hydrolysing)
MLEDLTLLADVFRLMPGHCVRIGPLKSEIIAYHRFGYGREFLTDKRSIIRDLESLFRAAIDREFSRDGKDNRGHLCTLSGGLDSRMVFVVALKNGYKDINFITWAQSSSLDARVAGKIAREYSLPHTFFALDSGDSLLDLSENVALNDGMAIYSGAAHARAAYETVDFRKFGLLHTGQLGDAVMGSFLYKPQHDSPRSGDGVYSRRLLDRIRGYERTVQGRYDSREQWLFYSRGFNGAVNGYWIAENYAHPVSPFMDVDLLEYGLSIAPEHRHHERIYLEWIAACHPEARRYVWAKAGMRPTNLLIAVPSLIFLHLGFEYVLSRTFAPVARRHMNPFDYWYKNNEQLRERFCACFKEKMDVLDRMDRELAADAEAMYKAGSVQEKTQVMTLIEAASRLLLRQDCESG